MLLGASGPLLVVAWRRSMDFPHLRVPSRGRFRGGLLDLGGQKHPAIGSYPDHCQRLYCQSTTGRHLEPIWNLSSLGWRARVTASGSLPALHGRPL